MPADEGTGKNDWTEKEMDQKQLLIPCHKFWHVSKLPKIRLIYFDICDYGIELNYRNYFQPIPIDLFSIYPRLQ